MLPVFIDVPWRSAVEAAIVVRIRKAAEGVDIHLPQLWALFDPECTEHIHKDTQRICGHAITLFP